MPHYKALTDPELTDLWRRRKQDPEARNRLIEIHHVLVFSTVGRYTWRSRLEVWSDPEDFRAAGFLGLIDAVDRFDPERGVKFSSYAIAKILGAIRDEIRSQDRLSRGLREKVNRLGRAKGELEETQGFYERADLLRVLGTDEDGLWELERISRLACQIHLENPVSTNGSAVGHDKILTSLGDQLADQNAVSIWEQALQNERLRQLGEKFQQLDPRWQEVLRLYYRDGLTFREVGKALGISESRAYQLHTQSIEKLRHWLAGSVEFDESRTAA